MQCARYLHANFGHVYLWPPQWLIVEGWVSFFIITIFTDGGTYILIFVAILEEFSFIYAKPLRNSIKI